MQSKKYLAAALLAILSIGTAEAKQYGFGPFQLTLPDLPEKNASASAAATSVAANEASASSASASSVMASPPSKSKTIQLGTSRPNMEDPNCHKIPQFTSTIDVDTAYARTMRTFSFRTEARKANDALDIFVHDTAIV